MGLQEALDLLDLPCARKDMERVFRPRVRDVLDRLGAGAPDGCVDSILNVSAHMIERTEPDREGASDRLPAGVGSGLVLHFHGRSNQIAQFLGDSVMPIRCRFAFIQIAALACLSSGWIATRSLEKSMEAYKARINEVITVATDTCGEISSWRLMLTRFLNKPFMLIVARDFVFSFVWAGYLIPGRKLIADSVLAGHLRESREQFNRFKQDGLRNLSLLLMHT